MSDLCPRRGSSKSVLQSVLQECGVRSVLQECQVRVSQKKCQASLSDKSVK